MSQISDDVSSLQSSVEVLELPENSLLGDISSLRAEIARITSSELYQRSRSETHNSQTSRSSSESFPHVESSPFKGIISALISECGGNVHENGVASITASSNHASQCHQVTKHGLSCQTSLVPGRIQMHSPVDPSTDQTAKSAHRSKQILQSGRSCVAQQPPRS